MKRDREMLKHRYLDLWDFVLRPFGRIVWRNPNCLFGVQFVRRPSHTSRGDE